MLKSYVKDVLNDAISIFSKNGKIATNQLENFGTFTNSLFDELYQFHKINEQVLFYCSLDKPNEPKVAMVIRRRTRKKNTEHNEIIKECLKIIENSVDMSSFNETKSDIINHMSRNYPTVGKNSYEVLGEIVFKR